MAFTKKPIKGMTDFPPADMRLRNSVLDEIKRTYAQFGFAQIETPMMEHIGNLTSKQGGDNEKLIFKVLKRGAALQRAWDSGDRDALVAEGLRYDLTVPLARFYANNKEQLPSPFRALQVGAVWRADQPAKGRFRQFVQCDIDVLGDAGNLAEIELITATSKALSRILGAAGVEGFTVHVNDRRILLAAARKAGFAEDDLAGVLVTLDKLDKIGFDGVRDELLENGAAPEAADAYLALFRGEAADAYSAAFCQMVDAEGLADVASNLDEIIAAASNLTDEGVSIVFDPTLVRGMGYYTGPIFEVTVDCFGISIAGGGRYDEMIGKFSGEDVCACGFSIGFERIIAVLKDAGVASLGDDSNQGAVAFLVDAKASREKRLQALQQAQALRAAGRGAAVLPMRKNMKRQIQTLEAEGFSDFNKVYAD
ncbi:MAG TPA: histidine--tRNA ligase [Eggerthellaceae bacterium]|nr:histidine--tRNA ligase [Eggerthellaceae bacterium]